MSKPEVEVVIVSTTKIICYTWIPFLSKNVPLGYVRMYISFGLVFIHYEYRQEKKMKKSFPTSPTHFTQSTVWLLNGVFNFSFFVRLYI